MEGKSTDTPETTAYGASTLHHIEVALEAAQSCLTGETPEIGSKEEAREWTLNAVRAVLLIHLPAVKGELSRA